MSRFNELYRGEPTMVIAQLECAADEQELRAALINALRRIDQLEGRVAKMDRTLKSHLDTVA